MILNNFLGVTPIEKIGVGLPFPLPDEKSGELHSSPHAFKYTFRLTLN
jgi:hypothetical protein